MIPYKEVRQDIGKGTLLECIVVANPYGYPFWSHDNGVPIMEDGIKYHVRKRDDRGQYVQLLSLDLEDVAATDYGRYRCCATTDGCSTFETVLLAGERSSRCVCIGTRRSVGL